MHKEASLFDDSLTRRSEILTQGFFPDSVSIALTFVFGHRKHQNMNSSCNWSNFGENWQKSRESDEYKLISCKRGISVEEDNNTSTDIEEISRSCFDSSSIKNMHSVSSPIKDGFVYKRRRMQRNTVALLSGENAAGVTEENAQSDFNLSSSDHHLALHEDSSDDVQAAASLSSDCQDNEKPSFSGRHHLDVHTTFNSQLIDHKNLDSVKKCATDEQDSARDVSHSAEGFTNKLCCSYTGNCNATNGTLGTSKSCVPCASILTVAAEHSGDCSTSGAISLESLEKFESPEEMCIYVLKRHGLLGESNRNSACAPSENLGSVGPLSSSCKICGISESALKMLICDDCEEAFHLFCCRPKIKRLPRDEWYCQSCFIKKRKHLLKKNMGTSSDNVGDISESGGPIASMLRGFRPHRSRVRIGEDFQVEVPDWSDPFSNDDYFGESKEMDHADCCGFEDWSWSKSSKSCSIGNWLQCKEEDDNGNICGKWRRAPLFSVQTDDWDCSSAVLWDPIHADCAVPQELDTEEVLKHLKYVEMLKSRMNNRMKPV